jgi:hypothetical protein
MDEIADRLKTVVNRRGPEATSGTDGAISPYGAYAPAPEHSRIAA